MELEKDFCKTKAVKKDPQREGKKSNWVGMCTPGKRQKEDRDYMGSETYLPWGVSNVSHILGTLAVGSDNEQMTSYDWFKDSGTSTHAGRNHL